METLNRSRRPEPVETREVDTRVVAVLPEFKQAELVATDGHRYALTEHTPGIRVGSLREGQQFRCVVTVRSPRVLQAVLVRR